MNTSALQIGRNHPLLTRIERVELLGGLPPVRLLYASDLHLTGRYDSILVENLVHAARVARPDVILLGGDLVDSHRGPAVLTPCIRSLAEIAPVLAIGGNHDRFWGLEASRSAVLAGGGIWLEDRSVLLPRGTAGTLRIDGVIRTDSMPGVPRILCAHDPAVFPEAAAAGYSLVMAGHLHGGQCVLAERQSRLYPGAWFYRYNGLRFHEGQSTLLVSRGAADTLPIRWNCPREVIACEIS